MQTRLGTAFILVATLTSVQPASQAAQEKSLAEQRADAGARLAREEEDDYFRKWLSQDVVFIITDEERAVFESLTTPEEKDQFIEQFWHRRDPDWGTAFNEFKEEHYRRIAYANEHYTSGQPGWKTDRGMIYIIQGPPDEIEARPTGGAYIRPLHEGGGTTGTYPFEIWRYRHIEGLGSDIELEFVDPTYTEEFRLARNPWEKDALLTTSGAGLTLAEEIGIADKVHRPALNPGSRHARENYPLMSEFRRSKDSPFRRYETYTFVRRAPELKYKDLKEIVDVNITYSKLPAKVRPDYFTLNEDRVLVPITVEFENKDLTFAEEGGAFRAKIGIYGLITTITNRVVTEFEDDVVSSYRPEQLEKGLQLRSMYQKTLPLDRKMRYKLTLVVKDVNGGNVGVIHTAITPPPASTGVLSVSSLILSDSIRPLEAVPLDDPMFVLGDVFLLPFLSKAFHQDKPLGVYFQAYGFGLDQATQQPSLRIAFRLMRKGESIAELIDTGGESIQYASDQRVVFIRNLSLQGFEPGEYQVEIELNDRVTQQSVKVGDRFRILPPFLLAQSH